MQTPNSKQRDIARGQVLPKIAEITLQDIHQLNLLQHAADKTKIAGVATALTNKPMWNFAQYLQSQSITNAKPRFHMVVKARPHDAIGCTQPYSDSMIRKLSL